MFKNYLTIAWRNLLKNKVFSLINILGLTIGITVCLMIFLFIMNEFSVDGFHKNGGNIYRVMRSYDASKEPAPWVSGPYATALLNDFGGEIKKAVRVMPSNGLVSFGNASFKEKKVFLADADFFTMFSFPLITGNPSTVLQEPGSVVLTESTAKKYFGTVDNAIGKVVELDKSKQLKVTGIAKDIPSNSHFNFDLVVPLANWYQEPWFNVWINNNNFTYVMLDERTNKAQLEKRFPRFMDKYMGDEMKQHGTRFSLSLLPLKEVYFSEGGDFDPVKHGDKTVVFIFLSVAVLILLIACINFMNLSAIRSVDRSREVGLRKVLGALRSNLIWQFIGESVLLTFIACILSVGLLILLMPFYNTLLGYTLTVSWTTFPIYLFLVGVIIVVGFLAGSYPAFFLSAFKPVESLKGKLKLGKAGSLFRQSLVVVQFSISVLLIVGTIVIYKQMTYVKTKELGYEKEHKIVVPIDNGDIFKHLSSFKNELQSQNNIASVSFMSGEPGGFFDMHIFNAEGQSDVWKARTEFADFEFVKTLGLKIIAGRDFSPQLPTDSADALLINRTAAHKLGYTPAQALGKWIKNSFMDSSRRRVVGVVEDFNFLSLREKMDALVISPGDDRRVIIIKIKPGNVQSAISTIQAAYQKAAPAYPFEYSFLDQKFDDLYKKEIRQQSILTLFAGLAIFIACLGLFGLASFAATKRFKEIGVRKVLGSSVQSIVVLLTKDLLKPVLIASCIALPVGYWAMSTWLQNFAYKTSLSLWIFLFAAAITLGIALLTVSIKAINAGLMNPVKSLRTE